MEPTELIKEQTANGAFLVSTLSVRGTERTVYAFYENGSAAELSCLPSGGSSILGNIYVGKVKNIAANINAAFIEIGDGQLCYYALDAGKRLFLLRRRKRRSWQPETSFWSR